MALRTVVVAVVATALGVAALGSAVACGSDSSNGDEVTTVAAGFRHTCAVTGAGGVKCWGANESGQLGNDTTADSTSPVEVAGLRGGVIAIAAGAHHSCAVTSAGGVKCWGWNQYGQLGDGKEGDDTNTPVDVSGLTSGVTAISANALHACALTSAGDVTCWGSTFDDQESPRPTNSDVPTMVPGLESGNTAITAGSLHACAITGARGVKCWGTNGNGELGDGTTTDSDNPVEISALTGVTTLAVGSSDDFLPTDSCALTSADGVKCWGPNVHGQLGNGSTTDSNRPVDVSGLTGGIASIAVGGSHTCAITEAQQLKCWGENFNGQLGDGSSTNSSTPVDVMGF